jgi:DNA polymerase-3 subunit delta'
MNPFNSLLGNDLIKHHLLRLAKNKALPNSLLFTGPDGVGKGLFAKALATFMLGQELHPDLHEYYPEGKIGLHSIHSMRKFSEEVYMAPFSAQGKIFILHDAERMWPYGANALLKTFEEPPKDTIIILISSMPEVILPTILSRCCTIRFHSLLEKDIITILKNTLGQSQEEAEKLASQAQGSPGKAVMLLKEGGNEIRKMILQLLAKGKIRDYRLLVHELEAITEKLEGMKKKVEESCREEWLTSPAENLTAIQLDSLEKEIDGAAAMKMKQDMRSLFDVILSWFRDIQLMRVSGNRKYLMNGDFEDEMEQALQRGEILPLEVVQEAISKAILSLERSVSLNLCLETLFLKISAA